MHTETAIVILAAGRSSRLGQPKQLLPFKGKSLLLHIIQTAKKVSDKIYVILGADSTRIQTDIKSCGAKIVFNEEWEEGMASSIRCGLAVLMSDLPDLESAIFMVCDQPFVTSDLLESLIKEKDLSGKSIIASAYSEIAGTPVLFDGSIFSELMELKGDIGARKIIQKSTYRLATVDFPLGKVDMDTAEDYKKLLAQKDLM